MVEQLGLGEELRAARKKSKMTTRSVASQLGLSHTQLGRLERGERTVSADQVIALCAVYGITGRQQARLVARVRGESVDSAWLPNGPIWSDQVTRFAALEAEAALITYVSVTLIPGIFQTHDYARQVMNTGGYPEDEIDWKVRVRMSRQSLLSHPKAPHFHVIIDETVLRRPTGGTTIMTQQLNRLMEEGQRPNVTIQVIPASCGVHGGLEGPFITLDFPERERHVYVEARHRGLFLNRPEDVAPFTDELEAMETNTLGEHASIELINQIKEGFNT